MPTTRYTNIGGQIIAEDREGDYSFYGADPLGSTVALYDSSGTATDTFTYWPYGEVRSLSGSTSTPFKFLGTWGYYGETSGRMYVRARIYRDKLARWQTADPLSMSPKRLHLSPHSYLYGFASPVVYVDPSGLRPWTEPGPDAYCSDTFPDCDSICYGIMLASLLKCRKRRWPLNLLCTGLIKPRFERCLACCKTHDWQYGGEYNINAVCHCFDDADELDDALEDYEEWFGEPPYEYLDFAICGPNGLNIW